MHLRCERSPSPLLWLLSWHPHSFAALRLSHRKTDALPPGLAACHRTRWWGPLQDIQNPNQHTSKKKKLVFRRKLCFAQKLAININPRDEYCWRKMWASLQSHQVSCTFKSAWVTTHQRNSQCARRWCTCLPDIWRCDLCFWLRRVRWRSSGKWAHTLECCHESWELWGKI